MYAKFDCLTSDAKADAEKGYKAKSRDTKKILKVLTGFQVTIKPRTLKLPKTKSTKKKDR